MEHKHIRNLRRLWQIIRNQPEKDLDLDQVFQNFPAPDQGPEPTLQEPCGTIFCIFGAAALSREFEGLSFKHLGDWGMDATWKDEVCFFGSKVFYQACKELFGLDEKAAYDLFRATHIAKGHKYEALVRLNRLLQPFTHVMDYSVDVPVWLRKHRQIEVLEEWTDEEIKAAIAKAEAEDTYRLHPDFEDEELNEVEGFSVQINNPEGVK